MSPVRGQGTGSNPPNRTRRIRYHPDKGDFVIRNGTKRFNRALYGTHSGFRIEAGDLPQFALYMPGIGGTLKLGIITDQESKWLNDFSHIEARYHPGMMIYNLQDPLLGKGRIRLELLAMSDTEGMVFKVKITGKTPSFRLFWAYGGASGRTPSRSGDLGADPRSIFFLTPEHTRGNTFTLDDSSFDIRFEIDGRQAALRGVTPPGAHLKVGDASHQESPVSLWESRAEEAPVLVGLRSVGEEDSLYFAVHRIGEPGDEGLTYRQLPEMFGQALEYRNKLAGQVQIQTPDPWLNTLGGTISVAADAIWNPPTYLHGAVAWRSRLQGWRGAYAGDELGWHERAKSHFQAFNGAQVLHPDTTIVRADTAMNLSRQKEKIGFGPFNRGYIARQLQPPFKAHHYDMNLVYIDQLLRHFLWTGDSDFLRQSWPVIQRHLAWEKRNFDRDDNNLYDAYACIWASDALEYSGGDVAYSSAYNYFENKMAARYASVLGKDPTPYKREARHISQAMDSVLWLSERGWYAEYRDRLGLHKRHPAAGLWTVYHTIDKEVPDPFKTYQLLRYVDTQIPHIPVTAEGLDGDSFYTLSTTDWKPYTWSVNNVAFAEVVHTALAYWEGSRKEEAYKLFKSNILDNMYMGSSPGNFAQLSSYDHFRGELYRDFADPIGISSRALVEGLFGIRPDVPARLLQIHPGFPSSWTHASLQLPDVRFHFERTGNIDTYEIDPSFSRQLKLDFQTEARKDRVAEIRVNGKEVNWTNVSPAVGGPEIVFTAQEAKAYEIKIKWKGHKPGQGKHASIAAVHHSFVVNFPGQTIEEIKDPQDIFKSTRVEKNKLTGIIANNTGSHTFFVKVSQDQLEWWQPVDLEIRPAYEIVASKHQPGNRLAFAIRNNTSDEPDHEVTVIVNRDTLQRTLKIPAFGLSDSIFVTKGLVPGSNRIQARTDHEFSLDEAVTNWKVDHIMTDSDDQWQTVDLSKSFNDRVTQIFKNKYGSPRPDAPTLQLPVQGIGNWTHTDVHPDLDDSGLRMLAGRSGVFNLKNGIPFRTPGPGSSRNIIYTSLWDHYPDRVTLSLNGHARHIYLLMAGSTNFMQSRINNGEVIVHYQDGRSERLALRNPTTWWPIERDYYTDEYAFSSKTQQPFRVHLKTGNITRHFDDYDSINGVTDRAIDGGAATVLDLPLEESKTLKSLELRTEANDVVIGLMSITLLK